MAQSLASTPEIDRFIEQYPQASLMFAQDMPSPIKPALVAGAIGAGLGLLFAGKAIKWGLIAGGATLAAVTIAEMSFAAGAAGGMLVTLEECKKSQQSGLPMFSTRRPSSMFR
jgi:hypothetical protein